MGSGKTAVGKQLARLLSRDFMDTDAEIELRTGVDIPFIFEKEGEEGFRRRESQVIDQLTQKNNLVLATGGGAILISANRKYLASRGYVIYLQASVEQQLERTRRSRNRPLLETEDPEEQLAELMLDRHALYKEVADYAVTTDGRRVQAVAGDVHRHLDKQFGRHGE